MSESATRVADDRFSRRNLLAGGGLTAMGLALASCTSDSASSTSDAKAAKNKTAKVGEPEVDSISIAISNPNYASQAPFYIGLDKGFWEAEGFKKFSVRNVDAPIQTVVAKGTQFGIDDTDATAAAVSKGTPLRMIGCDRDRESIIMALGPGIKTPADAMGKKAIMYTPGTRNFAVRAEMLKAWGLSYPAHQLQIVELSGGSDAWVQALLSKKVAVSAAFLRHIPQLQKAGATILPPREVNVPQEAIIAREDFIKANPNTVAHMFIAYLKGVQVYYDYNQFDYVIKLMKDNHFDIPDSFIPGHPSQVEEWSNNGGFRMAEMEEFIHEMKQDKLVPDDFTYQDFTDFTGLHQAQQALGLGMWPPPTDLGTFTKFNLL